MYKEYVNLTDDDIIKAVPESYQSVKGHKCNIRLIPMGFDIETTNDHATQSAYMYIWQFAIDDFVILGTKWEEFIELNMRLIKCWCLSEKDRVVIFIHNEKYEWQFMRKWLSKSFTLDCFFVDSRTPASIRLNNCIEYRDSLLLSQASLSDTAKTYCKTQKLDDFDYDVQRNSSYISKMTTEEIQYCINDVIILTEYYKYYIDHVIVPNGFFPITQTSIVRQKIKQAFKETGEYYVSIEKFDKQGHITKHKKKRNKNRELIQQLFPKSRQTYDNVMSYLYRGGYAHANCENTKVVIEFPIHIDFTSSYPAVLLHCYYPMSAFRRVPKTALSKYLPTHCCMMKIAFYKLQAKSSITYDSISKAIKTKKTIDDNGRVYYSEYHVVALTELDYQIYCGVYKWAKMKVLELYVAERGELPAYVTDVIKWAYHEKSRIKKYGDPKGRDKTIYEYYKRFVNSIYGCMCTKLYDIDIMYENDSYIEVNNSESWSKIVSKQILSPYWGIWCTAHARYSLFDLLIKLIDRKEAYLHCCSDTDSHFIISTPFVEEYIADWNNKTKALNTKYGSLFDDLGCYDLEHKQGIKRFKTLGAKRYILETYDKNGNLTVEATIAGLPKVHKIKNDDGTIDKVNKLEYLANKRGVDVFDMFDNFMLVTEEDSSKNICYYQDNETTTTIDGEKMHELSSVYIYPTSFKLTMTQRYLALIDLQSKIKERRIYG